MKSWLAITCSWEISTPSNRSGGALPEDAGDVLVAPAGVNLESNG
jgi:hypothetical protein